MPTILDEIVAYKREEIAAARRARAMPELENELESAPPVRDFAAALRAKHPLGLIAEVKRASPSAGLIRKDFDPVEIACVYEQHAAACVSVLTDEHFFQGCLQYLRDIRAAVSVPLLRKDFILDRYQVLEARAAGADCLLLIAECLDQSTLAALHECIVDLGMQALIEIYEPENVDRVLAVRPALLGINNRNLKTFVTDLDHSIRLRSRIPDDVLLVSESGIHSPEDVVRLQDAGIHAILVGETLMRADDIGAKVDELLRTR
jgi:indole-3-glycerol phosphate synthase